MNIITHIERSIQGLAGTTRVYWREVLCVLLLILVAGSLRLYGFSEYLHFELDQARDARVVLEVLQAGNIADLPLLGPRAGGTFLRLPPVFYELQYLSGLVFGATIPGIALFVPILGAGAVVLLYALVRLFASRHAAFGVALLYAVSPFTVFTSRYAWNPNPLPFFLLLGLYGWVRATTVPRLQKRQEGIADKKTPNIRIGSREIWYALAGLAFGTAMQLHTLAFLLVPCVLLGDLVLRRVVFSLRVTHLLAFALPILILFTPLILSEWATGGQNTTEFIQAFQGHGGDKPRSIVEKLYEETRITTYTLGAIFSGSESLEIPRLRLGEADMVVCNERCQKYFIPAGFLLLCVVFLYVALLFTWYERRRYFTTYFFAVVTLATLGLFGTWGMYTLLAYDLAPRFYILALPFYFLGLSVLVVRFPRVGWILLIASIGLSVCHTYERFQSLVAARTTPTVLPYPDRIAKESAIVPLANMEELVEGLRLRATVVGQGTAAPIYLSSEPEYQRAFRVLIQISGVASDGLPVVPTHSKAVYVLVVRTGSDIDDAAEKYLVNYTLKNTTVYANLTALSLEPKSLVLPPEAPIVAAPTVVVTDTDVEEGFAKRHTWASWWNWYKERNK
jgi:4-amino-4-deoxy-L-arabinose transferase-like glycosyltransferase